MIFPFCESFFSLPTRQILDECGQHHKKDHNWLLPTLALVFGATVFLFDKMKHFKLCLCELWQLGEWNHSNDLNCQTRVRQCAKQFVPLNIFLRLGPLRSRVTNFCWTEPQEGKTSTPTKKTWSRRHSSLLTVHHVIFNSIQKWELDCMTMVAITCKYGKISLEPSNNARCLSPHTVAWILNKYPSFVIEVYDAQPPTSSSASALSQCGRIFLNVWRMLPVFCFQRTLVLTEVSWFHCTRISCNTSIALSCWCFIPSNRFSSVCSCTLDAVRAPTWWQPNVNHCTTFCSIPAAKLVLLAVLSFFMATHVFPCFFLFFFALRKSLSRCPYRSPQKRFSRFIPSGEVPTVWKVWM